MNYEILATGSDGNCVILDGSIMVDCGVPYKTVAPHLAGLKLVLLTHLHGDHFNPATIRRLAYEKPALRFGCCEWMVHALIAARVRPAQIDVFDLEKWGQYNAAKCLMLSPVKLTHNSDNCGWKIFLGRESVFYATDTGTLDGIFAPGYDLYMVEANHTRAELEARLAEKQAAGEYAYEWNAAQNHLSYEQATDWLSANMGPRSLWVPMHGHKERGEASCQESAITGSNSRPISSTASA